jgi:flavorubredoxin
MFEIKKNIYWVGIKDWELRKFHGEEYTTRRGSTYNSYLIKDRKTVLVDTAWDPFKEEFVANLEKNVGLQNIDYIVVNHSEIDHSGSMALLMSKIPHVPVYCTQNGAKILKKHHHQDWNIQVVKTGDTLSLGEYELMFIEAPMLHWPDSMFTYVKGANVLLSNDAFGQHYATSQFYNDQVDQCELYQEALKYYANILTPFSKMVRQKIDQFKSLNLPVEIIAPSHGVIWRDNPLQIVDKYYQWAGDYQEDFVAVIYDTMWEATKKMAHAIAEGLKREGLAYKIIHSAKTDHTELIADVFRAKAVLVGSSTVNNSLLSSVAAVLELLKGMKFKNKVGAAFGSYGWSGEAVKNISERLEQAGIKVVQEGIRVQYNPTEEELAQCVEFGREFAKKL